MEITSLDLKSITISAKIKSDGSLESVGELVEKLKALQEYNQQSKGNIRYVYIAHDQVDFSDDDISSFSPLQIIKKNNLQEVISHIDNIFGPRRVLRKRAQDDFQEVPLIGRSLDQTAVARIYQEPVIWRPLGEQDQEPVSWPEPGYTMQDFFANGGKQSGKKIYKMTSIQEMLISSQRTNHSAPRIILLGQHGSGKSNYLRFIARSLIETPIIINGEQLVPIRVDLCQWKDFNGRRQKSLAAYLSTLVAEGSEKLWQAYLDSGELFLLMDGLEQIQTDTPFKEHLFKTVDLIISCPLLIACEGNAFFHYEKDLTEFLPVYLPVLSEPQQLAFIKNYFDFDHLIDAENILTQISRVQDLKALSSNTRSLSLLCLSVWENPKGYSLPKKRVDIYASMINNILGSIPSDLTLSNLSLRRKDLLERIAFRMLFMRKNPGDPITELDFIQMLLEEIEQQKQSDKLTKRRTIADKALTHFLSIGLLIQLKNERGDHCLQFAERSFHWYLAACRLNKLINNRNWDEDILPKNSGKITIQAFIDQVSWSPDYARILVFLAGLMEDPVRLIADLADGKKDDLYLHRRSLAAECIAEVVLNDPIRKIQNNLASEIIIAWLNSHRETCEKHIAEAIIALVKTNAWLNNQNIIKDLLDRIGYLENGADVLAWSKLLATFRLLRDLEINRSYTDQLAGYLGNNYIDDPNKKPICDMVLEIIRALGSSARTEVIQTRLLSLLDNPNFSVKVLKVLSDTGLHLRFLDAISKNIASKLKAEYGQYKDITNRTIVFTTISTLKLAGQKAIFSCLLEIITDEQTNEFEKSLSLSAVAGLDLGTFSQEHLDLVIDSLADLSTSATEAKVRDKCRDALSLAFQNTTNEDIRKRILECPHGEPLQSGLKKKEQMFDFLSIMTGDSVNMAQILRFTQRYLHDTSWPEIRKLMSRDIYLRIIQCLQSLDSEIRAAAKDVLCSLVTMDPDFVFEEILDIYRFGLPEASAAALEILIQYGGNLEYDGLIQSIRFKLLNHSDPEVIQRGMDAMKKIAPQKIDLKGLFESLMRQLGTSASEQLPRNQKNMVGILLFILGTLVKESSDRDLITTYVEALRKNNQLVFSLEKPFNQELSQLDHYGLRFFLDPEGKLKIKFVQDLCNIL